MSVNIFDIDTLSTEEMAYQQGLVADFNARVAEIKKLLVSKVGGQMVILHGPVSQGKDSTLTELILLEAYRQAIAEGLIESSRPLLLSTVDTLNESIPMVMYPRYCKKRVEAYAKECGINLYYDIVTPGLNDEYFVKFTGGQKLVPNATRRGDCSIILKVTPSERYVSGQLDRFAGDKEMDVYSRGQIISCVGSRTNEGSRRSGNMAKQGIKDKGIDELLSELEAVNIDTKGKKKLLKFAPIKHWATDEVFDVLRLAGSKPVNRMIDGTRAPIPGFLPDFSLLLELYGNGSNDVCEVAVGPAKGGAGCNGKARYGCWNCTMVATTDHSSTALTGYPRWNELGAEDALRVRDYLFRLSCDMRARAFHARAYDPSGFNRVVLQPNVLKPKHLDKMVRYASQLTVDSQARAAHFRGLVAQGKEMDHPGYRDIAEDVNIPPKAKRAFLEMYKECAQEPIFTSFSEEHALLLSFRWSIDGIGAAPYRPLAIWQQTKRGEGRIPYPMLNAEYEARYGKIKMVDPDFPLPDAMMAPIYKKEEHAAFAKKPLSLFDLWERPADSSDVYEADMNCTVTNEAKHSLSVSTKVKFDVAYHTGDFGVEVELKSMDFGAVKMDGRVVKPALKAKMMDRGIKEKAEDVFLRLAQRLQEKGVGDHVMAMAKDVFSREYPLSMYVPFVEKVSVKGGFKENGSKVTRKNASTQRVVRRQKGKIEKGNTRIGFAAPHNTSKLYDSHAGDAAIFSVNPASESLKYINLAEVEETAGDLFDAVENIDLNRVGLQEWKRQGGIAAAVAEHDEHLAAIISKRHRYGLSYRQVRQYGGTHVAEDLMARGVIMVKAGYAKNRLLPILKRTQIFASLGLFDLQSYSYKKIKALPRVVDMKDHRRDRAKIAMELRKLKNASRARAKEALRAHQEGRYAAIAKANLDDNLDLWVNSIEEALTAFVHKPLMKATKVWFDTGDVQAEPLAASAEVVMALATEGVSEVKHVVRKVLSASDAAVLTPKGEVTDGQVMEIVQRHLSVVLGMLSHAEAQWSAVSAAIAAVVPNEESYVPNVKQAILGSAPVVLNEDLMRYWNPSMPNAVTMVERMQALINGRLNHVRQWRKAFSQCHTQKAKGQARPAEQQLMLI